MMGNILTATEYCNKRVEYSDRWLMVK